jgi:purine-binding chemotaxis protein CheW
MELVALLQDPAAQQILEQRARDLAAQEASDEREMGEETMVFYLGGTCYGLPARSVSEVQRLEAYTPLPATPPCIVGLVNLRGRLITALDMRPLLDLPAADPAPDAFLLIINAGGAEVGLLADAVAEVRYAGTDLTPALSANAGRAAAWIRGIDRQLTLRLDPALLLADPRWLVNERV